MVWNDGCILAAVLTISGLSRIQQCSSTSEASRWDVSEVGALVLEGGVHLDHSNR